MKLSELQTNEYGIITKVQGIGAFRKRITEMGFIKGKKVYVVKNAPLNDPIEYNIMGYEVSLRRLEAAMIEVVTPEDAKTDILTDQPLNGHFNGVFSEEKLRKTATKEGKRINVAFVGNPNSGKTTLFNHASNSREHVGNYSGVTVDAKTAVFYYKGYEIFITDLPGTYSLTAYSPEELYVRKHIADNIPDVIVNVIDSSNLERNLYLTTQLIDMDVRVVIALNMYDELQAKGHVFNYKSLGSMIGIPIVPTIGPKGQGIPELFDKVINIFNDKEKVRRHIHINYGSEVENSIQMLRQRIRLSKDFNLLLNYSSRYLAIKLLENDKEIMNLIGNSQNSEEIVALAKKEKKRLENIYSEDSETIITDAKYGFIDGALKETYLGEIESKNTYSQKIDRWITDKYWGFPIFLAFMLLMFEATFAIGQFPMNWIESGVSWLGIFLGNAIPEGSFKHLITDGIIGGVGGVIVFLPNILILFFFISLMEDTGYMARAAFIMDKLMHKIGLHGKSFIPLIMGFGCNVPAVMATRTIENRNSRLITMMITPLMSCSARLPVYVLIISAFFPHIASLILFSLYIGGILLACIIALLLKKWVFKRDEVPFVMELPPYRIPAFRNTVRHMWHKSQQYLQKMGGVILVASILIWALGYFPRKTINTPVYEARLNTIETQMSHIKSKTHTDEYKKLEMLKAETNLEMEADQQENSFAGRMGKTIEPIMKPLGFDWKMSIGLLTGLAAKEVVVSTMGVLYQAESVEQDNHGLVEKLRQASSGTIKKAGAYTPLSALAFMIFVLIYSPCVAVIAAIGKESGSWKWAAYTALYTTFLAWMAAFLTYQIGSLFI